MAKSIAAVGGIALAPGVSANGRLYTKDAIAKMVVRAQERIGKGDMPLSMLSHHAADDDSTRIVGRITSMSLDDDGNARYTASIAGNEHGQNIASLLDTSDGKPAFLKNVSIRGWWAGTVKKVPGPDGSPLETAGDIELDGLDYTKRPGVSKAGVDTFAWAEGSARTETTERVPLTESVREARVTVITEDTAPAQPAAHVLRDGGCVTCGPLAEGGDAPGDGSKPYGNVVYADPGYQSDKKKRYPLDSRDHAKSAWSYISQAKNAGKYTSAQLKQIKGRIVKALRKFGVSAASEGWTIDPAVQVAEYYGGAEAGASTAGSWSVNASNGPVSLSLSSYCMDPADLDVILRAAAGAACDALASLDPDMDGDVDVPGVGSGSDPDGDAGESAPEAPVTEATTEDPAPDPAAVPQEDKEVPAMADTDKPAVETAPAAAPTETAVPAPAPAAPATVTLTSEQFAQLIAPRVTETAPPAAPVAEAAPAAPAAPAVTESDDDRLARLVAAQVAEQVRALVPAAPEPVTETQDEKIARLVKQGVDEAKQALVASGGVALERKGAVRPANQTPAGGGTSFNEHGQPAGWPDKPLHKYTTDEMEQYAGPVMDNYIMKNRAVTDLA